MDEPLIVAKKKTQAEIDEARTRSATRKLIAASCFACLFMLVEIAGGLISNSLALLSDATHLFSDMVGLGISIFAIWMGQRAADQRHSFGYLRCEIIGALGSVLLIWLLTAVLCYEAVLKVIHLVNNPGVNVTDGKVMFLVAVAGLVVNLILMKILGHSHGGHGHSHGGGGHGHSHGGGDHGHSHGSKSEESDSHGHGHGHGEAGTGSHGHGHGHGEGKSEEVKSPLIARIKGLLSGGGSEEEEEQSETSLLMTSPVAAGGAGGGYGAVGEASGSQLEEGGGGEQTTTTRRRKSVVTHDLDQQLFEGSIGPDEYARLILARRESQLRAAEEEAEGHSGGKGAEDGHSEHGTAEGGSGGEDMENINVRAAYIHALGDLVQSIGVVLAGGLIWWQSDINHNYQWQLADPACTFLFSILVLFTTVPILRSSLHVLMEGTPDSVDSDALRAELQAVPGVTEVHDLHIWSLTVGEPALSVHLQAMDTDAALKRAQKVCRRHGVGHTTIQVERPDVDYEENCHCPPQHRGDMGDKCDPEA